MARRHKRRRPGRHPERRQQQPNPLKVRAVPPNVQQWMTLVTAAIKAAALLLEVWRM